MKTPDFYLDTREQSSGFTINIVDSKTHSVKKMHNYSGKIINPPVLTGETITFSYKSGVTKFLVIINTKNNSIRKKTIN